MKLKDLLKEKKFYYALIILLIGISVNQLSSVYLLTEYGDSLPVLNDFILDKIPYFELEFLYDLFVILSVGLFIIYGFRTPKNAPYFILLFGILNLMRGIFIGLTPFGSPNPGGVGIFDTTMFRLGVYPSGHTGASFLAFLLAEGKMKCVFGFLSLGVVVFLFLARGHYSIDIFSALIFVYAIYCFGEHHFSNWRLKNA